MWIESRSTLHTVRGEAGGLSGEVVVDPPSAHLELPIARLRSGNPLYDMEMRRRVDERRHPVIAFDLRGAEEHEGGRYAISFDITFHGTTRSFDADVHVTISDDGALVAEGEKTFDVRDFGVQPPRLLGLRVHPEVGARVRLEGTMTT